VGEKPSVPENLIIFLTDQERAHDLNYSKGFSQDLIGTNWMAKNGLSFSNAFTNTNQCSVARSTFFTSKFPAQHGVNEVITSDNWSNPQTQAQTGLSPDLPNLATILKGEGYDVVYKGKAHLNIGYTRTMGTANPNDDEYIDPDLSLLGFDEWDPPEAGTFNNPWGITNLNEDKDLSLRENDQRFTNDAIDWIQKRQSSNNKKPFALIVSLVNPHDILAFPSPIPNTKEKYLSRILGYREEDFSDQYFRNPQPIPATISSDPAANYKPAVQAEFLTMMDNLFAPINQSEIKNYLNFYANLVRRADNMLQDIIQTVEKDKAFSDNTMIVKLSDHGELGLAHGGMRQKTFNAYEEAIKVPTIWSNTQFFTGKPNQSDALISNIDFLPTYLNLIGVNKKEINKYDLRGVDYSSILKGKNNRIQDHILFTWDDDWAGQDPPSGQDDGITRDAQLGLLNTPSKIQAVRSKSFKLVRYYDQQKPYKKQTYQEEFYDLRPKGKDYSKEDQRPLESINYSPWANALRIENGERAIGTKLIRQNYKELTKKLNNLVRKELSSLPKSKGVEPTYATRMTKNGERVDMFEIHNGPGGQTSELELAFESRAQQYYRIEIKESYLDPNNRMTEIWSPLGGGTIKGTNNPIYAYYKGLPKNLQSDQVRVASVFTSSSDADDGQASKLSLPFSLDGITSNLQKPTHFDNLINPSGAALRQVQPSESLVEPGFAVFNSQIGQHSTDPINFLGPAQSSNIWLTCSNNYLANHSVGLIC
jgi:arylsulfatase A-like enzyme